MNSSLMEEAPSATEWPWGSAWIAEDVLKRFTSDEEQVFDASDAAEISKFFRYVTMSTTSRIKTANPNLIPSMEEVFSQAEAESGEIDDDFPF